MENHRISDKLNKRKISDLKKPKDQVSWIYPEDEIKVGLEKKDKYLDVKIKSESKSESNFTWPKVTGDSYYLLIN